MLFSFIILIILLTIFISYKVRNFLNSTVIIKDGSLYYEILDFLYSDNKHRNQLVHMLSGEEEIKSIVNYLKDKKILLIAYRSYINDIVILMEETNKIITIDLTEESRESFKPLEVFELMLVSRMLISKLEKNIKYKDINELKQLIRKKEYERRIEELLGE